MSAARVTAIKSRTVKTYTLDIEDGEVRPVPYSGVARRYRVDRVVIEKVDGNFARPMLYGQVLKKDGSDSANRTKEALWSDQPAWLYDVVKGLA